MPKTRHCVKCERSLPNFGVVVGPVFLLGGRKDLSVVDAVAHVGNVDVDSGAAANY